MAILRWEEHCLECAVPDCYNKCSLYVRRSDYACSRFVYGIFPNKKIKGVMNWGADLEFRRWSKLETGIYLAPFPRISLQFLNRIDSCISKLRNIIFCCLPKFLVFGLSWRYSRSRNSLLSLISRKTTLIYDDFVIECFSPNKQSFNFMIEIRDTNLRYRDSIRIVSGWNTHIIPIKQMNINCDHSDMKLTIYPENNAQVRVIFTCLDIIKWRKKDPIIVPPVKKTSSSSKIKCIAWDLDNTIWDGILVEDGSQNLSLRPEAVKAIKELDKRGIIHTIISKNDYQTNGIIRVLYLSRH